MEKRANNQTEAEIYMENPNKGENPQIKEEFYYIQEKYCRLQMLLSWFDSSIYILYGSYIEYL